MATVAQHFTYSYPNPIGIDNGQVLYLVPVTSGTMGVGWSAAQQKLGTVNITCLKIASGSFGSFTLFADAVFNLAVNNGNDPKPSPNLSGSDIDKLINSDLSKEAAENIINYVFGNKSGTEMDVNKCNLNFNQAYTYGVSDVMDNNTKAVRWACNYTAVLLT